MTEFSRSTRVGDEVQRVLSTALVTEASDERLRNVTIRSVEMTGDLRQARAYWLLLGDDGTDPRRRRSMQRALDGAKGFLRARLAERLRLKHVPEIQFFHDDVSEQGRRIDTLLEALPSAERSPERSTDEDSGEPS